MILFSRKCIAENGKAEKTVVERHLRYIHAFRVAKLIPSKIVDFIA